MIGWTMHRVWTVAARYSYGDSTTTLQFVSAVCQVRIIWTFFFSFFLKKSEVWTSIGRTSAFPNFFLGWCAIMQHISIGESKLTNIPQALDEWGRMEGIFPVQVTTGNDRWVRYARSIFWSTIPHEGSLQSIGKFFFSHAWTFSICLNKLQP